MNETTPHPPVVLIIDDEVQIRRLLRVALEGSGYRVFDAATGQEGLIEAAQRRPDAVVLDLGLPDMDGVTVLQRLREWSQVPVLVLSVREGEDDKVSALDNGADDFVTKPFSTAEFLARLRVARRRGAPMADNAVFRSGRLEVDRFPAPQQVDTQARALKRGSNWIISASGGVLIQPGLALQKAVQNEAAAKLRSTAGPVQGDRWWWN